MGWCREGRAIDVGQDAACRTDRRDALEATRTQQLPEGIASHTRAFAFFGGEPAATYRARAQKCDQLKSGVTVPCRYEPGVHRVYAELAAHYGTTILPARPRKPRDKAQASHCDSFRTCGASFS